jgi:hypothetical protein
MPSQRRDGEDGLASFSPEFYDLFRVKFRKPRGSWQGAPYFVWRNSVVARRQV